MTGCSFSFGDSPEMADWLLGLVLAGKKTATCGAVRDFGPEAPMPEVGRRDTVLDGAGRPAAVIEMLSVRRAPVSDVDLAFVLAEGEGDANVAEWLAGHGAYFARNGGFAPDMEVIFEHFRVVEVLPRTTGGRGAAHPAEAGPGAGAPTNGAGSPHSPRPDLHPK